MAPDGTPVEIRFAFSAKVHRSGRLREKRVVHTDADVRAGHYRGTALADDDLTHTDFLPVAALDTQILRI